MISLISTFLRHYLFCFLGASFRYLFDFLKYKLTKKTPKPIFKSYRNYEESPDVEMIDAIIGFITLGILLMIIIPILRIHNI
ncbi:hypothetical protein H3159_06565 [Flavobacterium sp. xlx-221]|uniref:hypothetical protein n=1 Tax=Flavobacterium sp. xlx-214 TaxID=2654325 RepID=UPI0013D7C43F|nr:hypothetical protein [Flavobacterium sp. xlx-214]MBA5792434.1 hypothetical protein [Flavobacterium sp. xlx-221]